MLPPPPNTQTIHIESKLQANKLAKRLCDHGLWFTCQYSYPHSGRWFTFSDYIDFERHKKSLFQGIVFSIGEGQPIEDKAE